MNYYINYNYLYICTLLDIIILFHGVLKHLFFMNTMWKNYKDTTWKKGDSEIKIENLDLRSIDLLSLKLQSLFDLTIP